MAARITGHTSFAPRATPSLPRPAAIWQWLVRMHRVTSTRKLLAEMDARMLSDIGISRGEARREMDRAPWDFDSRR
jgi:uncharacterized protein YjiS (DUF1127 family)